MSEWFDELSEFLRIPSISAEAEHRGDVIRAGEWVRDFIVASGGEADLVDWEGQPLVVGEILASHDAAKAPTVLCYGHFDVQPAEPLDLWDSEPFEPVIRGERLYARGSADDKGQLYMLLAGARKLAKAGQLPVNVRFACDGEEETGGHSIVEFIEADERGADAAIIFDSGMIARDRPQFNVATRGLIYFHLEFSTGLTDLHSGEFGGAAMNAAHALIRTLDALIARDGRLVEPLRAGIVPPSAAEVADWAKLPTGEHELSAQGATPADAKAAEEFYLRTCAEPTFEVNGIESGSPHVEKTVLPVRAAANVSFRLAPGQDPAEIAQAFERLVQAAVPDGAELTVTPMSAADPGLVDPGSVAIRLGQDAFERVLGVRPALTRIGGTLPIVAILSAREIPTIITGFSLPDSRIHAPNENLIAEYVPQGIEAAAALFEELAGLG